MEREAALEARRNAQRSHISFAFGSSVPRNVDSLQGGDTDKISKHSNTTSGLLPRGTLIYSLFAVDRYILYCDLELFIFLI